MHHVQKTLLAKAVVRQQRNLSFCVSYHSIIIGWEKDKRQGGIGPIENISSSTKKYLQCEFCGGNRWLCCIRSDQRCNATSVDSNNYRAINSKIERNVIVSDVCSRTDIGVAGP
jgi:hypothetical protein